jgi:hypothetical protein
MKGRLRKLFLLFMLAFAAIAGVLMDPQKIEDLLNAMNQTKIELTINKQKDEDKSKKSGP